MFSVASVYTGSHKGLDPMPLHTALWFCPSPLPMLKLLNLEPRCAGTPLPGMFELVQCVAWAGGEAAGVGIRVKFVLLFLGKIGKIIEFFRNSQSWNYRHFCVTSNGNKLLIFVNQMNLNTNLDLSRDY